MGPFKILFMGIFVRSEESRVAGICAAVAERFGWKARNVRLLWVLLSVVGLGAPVLFYIVLWLVTPAGSRRKMSYEERMNERFARNARKK